MTALLLNSDKINEAIQDGHAFSDELIRRIIVGLDEMPNETSRAAFKEEFISSLTKLQLIS